MKICQIQHTILKKSQILNHFFVVMSFHGICNLCIFVNLKIKFHYFIIIIHPKYVVQGILVLAMGMIFSRASGLFFVSNKKIGRFWFCNVKLTYFAKFLKKSPKNFNVTKLGKKNPGS
jgi:hypothetical protein